MGRLRILGEKGDQQVVWSTKDEEELARKVFNEHLQKGYMAFRKDENGETRLIRSFEADAEQIVIVPPVAGG